MRKCSIILSVTLLVLMNPAKGRSAGSQSFAPTVSAFFGELEFEGLHETNRKKTNRSTSTTDNITLRQYLELGFAGYIYHPNFVSYMAEGSGGVEEQKFSANQQGDWRTASTENYSLRAFILPRHRLNLELFSEMTAPLLSHSVARQYKKYQSGAYLRYAKRPMTGMLGYVHDRTESAKITETETYQGSWGFHKSFLGLNSNAWRRDRTEDGRVHTITDYYSVDNSLNSKNARLSGNWQREEETEETGDELKRSRWLTTWNESLHLTLPLNFKSLLGFRQNRNRNDSDRFIDSRSYRGILSHRLFRSVASNINVNRQNIQTSRGDKRRDHIAGFVSYSKTFFKNNSFGCSYTQGRSNDIQEGAPITLDEQKNTDVFNQFALTREDVDFDTLVVRVRDNSTDAITTLQENVHYEVLDAVNPPVVRIIDLPAPEFDITLISSYDFLVSYGVEESSYDLTTDFHGYSFNMLIFDKKIKPYYSYNESSQTLNEGAFLGVLDHKKISIYGIEYRDKPVSGELHYKRIESKIIPERSWAIEVSYEKDVMDDSVLHLLMEREQTEYFRGENNENRPYSEWKFVGQAMLSKNLRQERLISTLGLKYAKYSGNQLGSTLYGLDGTFRWLVGKLEMKITGNVSYTEAQGPNNDIENIRSSLFFKITRELF